MTIDVVVNVVLHDVKYKGPGGDTDDATFLFQQVAPQDTIYVDETGKIDISAVGDQVAIGFHLASPFVTIEDQVHPIAFGLDSADYIWISEGENSTPTGPYDGTEFEIGSSDNAANLAIVDDNNDGKKYQYMLRVFWNPPTGGTRYIADDPKIVNRTN